MIEIIQKYKIQRPGSMSGLLFWVLLISCLLNACQPKTENVSEPIAKCGEQTLYLSDVTPQMPAFKDSLDSLNWLSGYVDNWSKEQIIIQKALFNLAEDQVDFEKEIQDYRNSLIRHLYEQELLKKYLDTVVTAQEIERFYNDNKSNFILRGHIVKYSFIQLPNSLKPKVNKQLKKSFKDKSKEDWIELEKECFEYQINHQLFDTTWFTWSDVEAKLQIHIENETNWLRYNRYTELQDSMSVICLKIDDYKLKKEYSPLQFEAGKIEKIILHQRKLKLLEELESEIYQDAKKKGEIKRYF